MSRNLLADWLSNPEAFAADYDQTLVNRIRRKAPHRDRRRAQCPPLPRPDGHTDAASPSPRRSTD